MRETAAYLICLSLSPGLLLGAGDPVGDVYEEDAIEHHIYKPPPGSERIEQDLVLPPYPRDDNLIGIDVGRRDFPYKVLVDGASLSVGKDRIVRYTVVLRSRSGVDNVSFEGIRCNRGQYKRYAYGANGGFRPVPANDWAYIRQKRQDIYRAVLAEEYFCPLPTGDVLAEIRSKLKGGGGGRYIFPGDEE